MATPSTPHRTDPELLSMASPTSTSRRDAKAEAKAAKARAKALRPWYRRPVVLIIGAVIVLGVIVASCAVAGGNSSTTTGTGAAPSAPTAPAGGFGSGTQLVNTDVQPGTYRAGVDTDRVAASCYWERLASTSGEIGDVIANAYVPSGTVVVTIEAGDVAFNSVGCTDWVPVD